MEQPISQALGDHLPWLIRISQRVCGWINEPELMRVNLVISLGQFPRAPAQDGLAGI